MAKIAVVAANGKASRKIISEALSRGFDVTAFGRHEENNTEAKTYVRKDILDLTREDLAGFDAVVSGFGAFTPETFPLYQTTTEHLADMTPVCSLSAVPVLSTRTRSARKPLLTEKTSRRRSARSPRL